MARLSLSSWNLLQRLLSEPADEALWDQTIAEETINAELTELALQAFGVDLLDARSVSRYISLHRDMLWLTADVASAVYDGLTGYKQILLSVYSDPEIEDEYLYMDVRAWEYPNDFLDQIDEVCKRFKQRLLEASGWLVVSTDFRNPGR